MSECVSVCVACVCVWFLFICTRGRVIADTYYVCV